MSSNTDNTSYPDWFRRRTLGRASSPPTWACYEQIPFEDDYSDSASDNNSCSEDEEDYDHVGSDGERRISTRSPSFLFSHLAHTFDMPVLALLSTPDDVAS